MTWIAMLAVGLGSLLFRAGPLLLLERKPLGAAGDRLIRHGGTAAITALIALSTTHSVTTGHALPALLAVAVATWLAIRGQSMLRIVAISGAMYALASVLLHVLR